MLRTLLRWCGVHVHTWSKWQDVGELNRIKDDTAIAIVQKRQCTECLKWSTRREYY